MKKTVNLIQKALKPIYLFTLTSTFLSIVAMIPCAFSLLQILKIISNDNITLYFQSNLETAPNQEIMSSKLMVLVSSHSLPGYIKEKK